MMEALESEEVDSPSTVETAGAYQPESDANFKNHPVNSLPRICRLVKLYEINSTIESWVDKGTGYCYFDVSLSNDNPRLVVALDYEGVNTIVSTNIQSNIDYSSQNGSIIIWQEGGNSKLYRALSFQNAVGHKACWSYIKTFIDAKPSAFDSALDSASDETLNGSPSESGFRVLPAVSVSAIHKLDSNLEGMICQSGVADAIFLDLLEKKWLMELFQFMNTCIDSNCIPTLSSICSILFRVILNWCGNLELMHMFVSDDIFFSLLKAFEYDNDLVCQDIKLNHVDFFNNTVKYHDVLSVDNATFNMLVNANYRINYIKDVVLPRHLDEYSLQRLNNTIYTNITEILGILMQARDIFTSIRENLAKNYMYGLLFRELLLVIKNNQMLSLNDKNTLIIMIKNHSLLNEVAMYIEEDSQVKQDYELNIEYRNNLVNKEYIMMKSSLSSKGSNYRPDILLSNNRYHMLDPISLCIDIFYLSLDIFPSIVRNSIFNNNGIHGYPKFLYNLCYILYSYKNESIQIQCREIFLRILDPKNMDLAEKDEICTLFYDKGVLDYLINLAFGSKCEKEGEGDVEKRNTLINAKLYVMDILSLCAREHKHRFKLRMQNQQLLLKIFHDVLQDYDKFLVTGALKFLSICISMKDSLVEKHIIKYNILRPVLWILVGIIEECGSGSILESLCLNILYRIESNVCDTLIVYLFEDEISRGLFTSIRDHYITQRNNSTMFNSIERIYNYKKYDGVGKAVGSSDVTNSESSIFKRKYNDPDKWFEEEDVVLGGITSVDTGVATSSPSMGGIVEGYDDVEESVGDSKLNLWPIVRKVDTAEDEDAKAWISIKKGFRKEGVKEKGVSKINVIIGGGSKDAADEAPASSSLAEEFEKDAQ